MVNEKGGNGIRRRNTRNTGRRGIQGMGFWKRLRLTLEMIKFEHSVFALPFALTGALAGISGEPFRRPRIRLQVALDRDRHGGRAVCRDGVQSHSGRRHRRTQSANAPAPHPGRNLERPFRLGLCAGFRSGFSAGGARAESAVLQAGAGGVWRWSSSTRSPNASPRSRT